MENMYELTVKELVEMGGEVRTPQRVNSDKAYKKKMNQRKLSNEQFVRVKEDFNKVKKLLSLEQSGMLMFLLGFVKFNEEGQLFNDSKRMTVSDIAKLLGKSEAQTRKVLSELEGLSLIYREKVGRNVFVSLGETFFNCGYSEDSFKFVKVYKTRLKEIAKKLTLSEIGFLMQLLSHFHWETHLLVDNPSETDKSKLVIWSRKHIAEELGLSIDFVKRAIPKLRKVQAIVEVKSAKTGLVLAPSLVCRQEQKPSFDKIVRTINEAGLTKENFKK
jgi:predicted transcriptional regulator